MTLSWKTSTKYIVDKQGKTYSTLIFILEML